MGNRAIVLSGGGAKGAFELGVVDYLVNDLMMDFQVICGVSTGALNASFLSQGKGYEGLKRRLEELKEIWFSISSNEDIYLEVPSWDFFRLVSLVYNEDISHALEINRYIGAIAELRATLYQYIDASVVDEIFNKMDLPYRRKSQRYVNITIFEPDTEYMGGLEFDPVKIKKAFRAGREKAREVMSSP